MLVSNHILYLWHFSCFPLVWNFQNLQMLQQSDKTPYLGWVFLVPQWFTNQATDAASLAAFKDVPRISELETCESRGICWVDISGDMHPIFCIEIPCFQRCPLLKMIHHPANQNESDLIYQNASFAGLSFNWESSISTKRTHKSISRNTVKWKSLASYMSQWYSMYLGTEQQRLAWDSLDLEGSGIQCKNRVHLLGLFSWEVPSLKLTSGPWKIGRNPKPPKKRQKSSKNLLLFSPFFRDTYVFFWGIIKELLIHHEFISTLRTFFGRITL